MGRCSMSKLLGPKCGTLAGRYRNTGGSWPAPTVRCKPHSRGNQPQPHDVGESRPEATEMSDTRATVKMRTEGQGLVA